MSTKHNEHDMHLMVRVGETQDPKTDNNLWSLFKTENGVIFSVFRGEELFHTNVFYSFLITGNDNTIVNIIPRFDTGDPIPLVFDQISLKSKTTLSDILLAGHKVTYSLDWKTVKNSL